MLRPAAEASVETLSFLGIGIRRVDSAQHHVAFIYQAADGSLRLSHLMWHHVFCGADPFGGDYYWSTVAGIDNTNRKVFAAWLGDLAAQPPTIGYGFSYEDCVFVEQTDGSYRFVSSAPGKGLTCATFLTVALRTLGFDLVIEESWPHRADDLVWQAKIINMLRTRMTQEEIDSITADIGCIRYRPIEIIGSGVADQWPVDFADAEGMANQILAEIAELRLTA